MDIYDDLVLEEPLPPITEEDIERLHKYLDEALEDCGDLCLPEFEETLEIWKWHKGWG